MLEEILIRKINANNILRELETKLHGHKLLEDQLIRRYMSTIHSNKAKSLKLRQSHKHIILAKPSMVS